MKWQQHNALKYIYDRNEVEVRALTEKMVRRYNDHRDFYPLAALLVEGFIGFTGGVPKPEDSGYPHQDAYYLSRIFHCYSMGPGSQRYDGVAISVRNKDSNFFIAGKGLLYFHERAEKRREWWAVAALGLVSAIIAGCATGLLAAKYWPA